MSEEQQPKRMTLTLKKKPVSEVSGDAEAQEKPRTGPIIKRGLRQVIVVKDENSRKKKKPKPPNQPKPEKPKKEVVKKVKQPKPPTEKKKKKRKKKKELPPEKQAMLMERSLANAEESWVLLENVYPTMFDKNNVKPFAVGVFRKILEEKNAGKFDMTRLRLKSAMCHWVNREDYFKAVINGSVRYWMDGSVGGEITQEEKEFSAKKLAEIEQVQEQQP